MTWLLPGLEIVEGLTGTVRTVKGPTKAAWEAARAAARYRRYRQSPKGRANAERNRERRNAYHMEWHRKHLERRRAYLAAKAREYRAKRKQEAQ